MKIVVDINHPAHVHYFKNFIWEMQKNGHEILITASEKEVSYTLLDNFGFSYVKIGNYGKSILQKLINIPILDLKMYKAVRKFQPDLFLGFGSIRAAHVSKLIKKPYISLDDTEHAKWEHLLYVPFTDVILTPSCFKKDFGAKHIRYNGYTELAYLYPKYYKSNPRVLDELNLSNDDIFFVLRLSSFDASHDLNSSKMKKEYIRKIIDKLEKQGKIIVFSESELDSQLKKYEYTSSPDKYHDILFYSHLYIGEGSTSAEEAAILGTPSLHFERVKINGQFQGISPYIGVLEELENKYKLLFSFYNEDPLLNKLDELLLDIKKAKLDWNNKKELLLKDKIDLTAFLVWFIENYPESFIKIKGEPHYLDSPRGRYE